MNAFSTPASILITGASGGIGTALALSEEARARSLRGHETPEAEIDELLAGGGRFDSLDRGVEQSARCRSGGFKSQQADFPVLAERHQPSQDAVG